MWFVFVNKHMKGGSWDVQVQVLGQNQGNVETCEKGEVK